MQEKQGESLATQKSQIGQAVTQLGSVITRSYCGQEHATVGWERKQLDQLLADSRLSCKPFDAVIVTNPDRWSRDNIRNSTGLQILKENGIRFFVLTQEHDLYNPKALLYLSLSAVIGAYHASNQTKKSLLNRIERARRGWPASGKLPFGRTFDRAIGQWGIKTEVQNMMIRVATRYLAGESMANLAVEYRINHSFLHKTLTTSCGTLWNQTFCCASLGISEAVPTVIPALLTPEVIEAVRRKAVANRTFSHGHLKNKYLFSRVVFCGNCGYAMSGEIGPHGKRYYRHQCRNGALNCSLNLRFWAPADLFEEVILAKLAELWGNPKAVEKAIADAEPNRAEAEQAHERLKRIEAEQAEIRTGRERLLRYIAKGIITDEQAERQLNDLRTREVDLVEEADRLQQRLAGRLSPADRERLAEQLVEKRRRTGSRLRDIARKTEDPGENDLATETDACRGRVRRDNARGQADGNLYRPYRYRTKRETSAMVI